MNEIKKEKIGRKLTDRLTDRQTENEVRLTWKLSGKNIDWL